ncbi:LAME_0H08152g1_1 [Lachancea meyersii CBS 8951]|uniref:LAME_0H08152g1_1 n=1 Tax=Lachancea meyersii CBS 8951 TaxID=1266667 RepID=A0A1G4KF31_9SACH|nr:LAME_0H08152g1_1 [Lachancea meyersii CBS 8951]
MDRKRLASDACKLLKPMSRFSTDEIVLKYAELGDLNRQILRNPRDFTNEFWVKFEKYGYVEEKRLRVCQNLTEQHGNGPVFVFIHGLGGNMTQFEPLLRLLAELNEGFLALDLPGFGYSDEMTEYDIATVAGIVEKTVQIHTQRKKLVLVGHSLGCHIVMHFISEFASNYDIRDAVFLSPAAPDLPQLKSLMASIGLWVLAKVPVLFDWYRTYFDQKKGLESSGIKKFHHKSDTYRKLWQFFYNVQIKSRSIIQYLRGWTPINWSSDTVAGLASAVVITGKLDPITPLSTAKSFYAALDPVRRKDFIEIEECSHNICFDSPNQIVSHFLDVIDRHG